MKIITKNGVIYNSLSVSIISDLINSVKTLVVVVSDDRKINYDKNNEFIDDITQDELNKGLEAVKEILANENELLKEYFLMFKEVSTQEASLKYAKEFKKDEIDKARDKAIEGGVSFKDKIFQSSEKDRNLLTSTVSLFSIAKQVPEDFVWITQDNTAVPFTLEELIQLGSIMANSVNTNTIKARELKDKIEQATSLEELNQIAWENKE
ncbi:DUF4376 domain-containing protein [Campylobacter estrildidarum]|uniref:DUF4376 domain-containing protein n=1 Tax=Campylobacter estrildidarum TaxID=2510189 RepID=A0A4U7BNA5_9BACT|nr:DUF4376 domain-containing protein [Campylobacter estrildidarum]TKX29517.1 hypothetical protein CQA69_07395 [Campylobacter estrildidarum]